MALFGNTALWVALGAAVLSSFAYRSACRGRGVGASRGRGLFALSTVAVLMSSAALLHAFVAGRYELAYVADYSSRSLPLLYRVSAFWAGQEGSFLLWALLGGAMGVVLSWKGGEWEPHLMGLFGAVQAFLLLLLVAKSPFRLASQPLADGHGLNPLLQDPWMAIHPPLIFLGYAALAVPFVFAVAALLRREYHDWAARALPWSLFSWTTLGAGIFIGGYWAYRVLGWGGYWGWDPVENASLIPWLLNTALLHGILLQRARGSLARGNLALAILSFVMVLYGTFLTRSGVLSDFSVHSFARPGMA
ncbi:MAG: cytochrome c biogenesis protein CcsA, partial [Armatimonadota bacterium]|nr:cytochrome c biogenesis protein CcsA [Armatimonadota bacterium]